MVKGERDCCTIAIDLGTSSTRAAVCRNGVVESIASIPSYVAFTSNGDVLVGEAAMNQAATNPLNTLFDANRLIGRQYSDPSVQTNLKLWPFKIVSDQNNKPVFSIQQHGEERQISPQEICAVILIHIKELAESYLGNLITNAIITVPNYFNHLQKQVIKDAGSTAGLSVRLANSSMTAVMNYGFEKSSNGHEIEYHILLFDLGAGTSNVSVVNVNNGVFDVKSVTGDLQLGGEDFDNRMINYCLNEFKKKHKMDLSEDPRAMSRLRTACERAKINLSNNSTNTTSIGLISLHDGVDFHSTISKCKFEELNMDLFQKCIECVDQCVKESTVKNNNISEVILLGGSTRIPKLQYILQKYFDKRDIIKCMSNRDESVISGTAVLSAFLNNDNNEKIQDLMVLNVTAFSYGIEIEGGLMAILIGKNKKIPKKKELVFVTDHDNQKRFSFRVFEEDRGRVKDDNFLGEVELIGIPPAQKGVQKIHVCFDVDVMGTLIVSAENKVGKIKEILVFNINSSEVGINNGSYHEEDECVKRVNEAKDLLVNYIENLKKNVRKNKEISSVDKHRIEEAMSNDDLVNSEDFIIKMEELKRIYKGIMEKVSLGSRFAIGIDFGTTYSCVGVWIHDNVEIVCNEEGSRVTPSCVAFNENERLVGDLATNQSSMNPTNSIFDIKRLIGRYYSDPSIQNDVKSSSLTIISDSNKRPNIVIQYKNKEKYLLPEEITSMIFTKMKEISEMHIGTTVENAVIALPSYFSHCQRNATRNAAKIAGLNVIRIINEPTAAAIAYHSQKISPHESSIEKNIFVFDLGGGYLDTSVINIINGVIKVRASFGNNNLGGDEFDDNMVAHFVEEFKRKEGKKEISSNFRAMRKLRNACEKAKRVLSTVSRTTIVIDALFDGIDFCTAITRDEFEEINMNLFQMCTETIENCLYEANIKKSEIDDVVVVGSSTRIPKIQQLLQDFFNGKELCKSINPDEAIAYGATIHAASMNLEIHDVTATTLGLETVSGDITILIPRNTSIPTSKEHIFTTNSDNQPSISIHLWACESGCFLGKFDIIDIPPRLKALPKICVSFNIDLNGILDVKAYDITRGEKIEIGVKEISCGLTNEEIEKLKIDLENYKSDDQDNVRRIEAKNNLEDYAYKAREMSQDARVAGKLYFTEKRKIARVIDQAITWLDAEQFAETSELEDKLVELKRVCEPLIH